MKNFRVQQILFCLLILIIAPGQVYSLSIRYEDGIPQVTQGISTAQTYGNMMAGMIVTAYFNNGTVEEEIWKPTGNHSGGVFGTNWSLSENGHTINGLWSLSNNSNLSINRILIDAGMGNSVFDLDDDLAFGKDEIYGYPHAGTAGTGHGTTFLTKSVSNDLDLSVIYRDIVALDGVDPKGDIYRSLDIQFNNTGGFSKGSSLVFSTDTDNLTTIPEPATMILFGVGVLGVIGSRISRKKNNEIRHE